MKGIKSFASSEIISFLSDFEVKILKCTVDISSHFVISLSPWPTAGRVCATRSAAERCFHREGDYGASGGAEKQERRES